MYAKVFQQILDSSIAEDWQTRHVFEDFLKLCDLNGVVDMTPESISRRTNVPLDVVKHGIAELEKPDPRSRNPDHEGRRIVRLDPHRDWGWYIVNYQHYRSLVSEEQRREKTRSRVANFRQRKKTEETTPTRAGNADVTPVTLGNSSNAMQREMKKEKQGEGVPLVLKMSERITLDGSLKRAVKELEKLGPLSDHDKGTKNHNRVLELQREIPELRKKLGVIA